VEKRARILKKVEYEGNLMNGIDYSLIGHVVGIFHKKRNVPRDYVTNEILDEDNEVFPIENKPIETNNTDPIDVKD
ncbi:unnamed protein product, partial [Dovyalis caffra]